MKDIIQYIEDNRLRLDTEIPDSKIWNEIESVLPQKASNKKVFLWLGAACMATLIGLTYFFTSNPNDGNKTQVWVVDKQGLVSYDTINETVVEDTIQVVQPVDSIVDSSGVYGFVDFSAANSVYFNIADISVDDEMIEAGLPKMGFSGITHDLNKTYSLEFFPYEYDELFYSSEEYNDGDENPFRSALKAPKSTFGIDVDGASYSNTRRFIEDGSLPPSNSVRVEEYINYFDYDLKGPSKESKHPLRMTSEVGICPWNKKHKLVQVAIKGREIKTEDLPPSNLVFLIDVSGSMDSPDKLGLLKKGLLMLVDQLRFQDQLSIVVYAGAAGQVLSPASGNNKQKIKDVLDNLTAGGSTDGGEGIKLAYEIARKHFVKDGNNRVLLATDGDFNVGVWDDAALVQLIEEKRKSGIYLSVLGFGTGNLKDAKMEKIANHGNGNYAYIDNVLEAKKVLVNEFAGTMFTIAKDVKMQVEFNPTKVKEYRLIGYENRVLKNDDFTDDSKDAGELGAGHTIIAMYEIAPAYAQSSVVRQSKYSKTILSNSDELMTVHMRYKKPDAEKSIKLEHTIGSGIHWLHSRNYNFAVAVAEFGLLMKHSAYRAHASYDRIIETALSAKGLDVFGYRAEFIRLVEKAKYLTEEKKPQFTQIK